MITTSGVVAQVWRGGRRQARTARLLGGIQEIALTPERSRQVGVLLGPARTSDVVDGSLVEAARDGDEILTSDPDDITRLAEASGRTLLVTPI